MVKRPLRRWLLPGLLGLVASVGGIAAAGLLLPVTHHVVVRRVVAGSPEDVWRVVTGIEAFPSWRPGVEEVRRLDDRDGFPVWVERGPRGSMTLEASALEPPRRMVTRIADEGIPFGGTWTYELEPAEAGTLVRITEDGEIYNPVFRFVARFVMGYDGTINAYLDGLERRMRSPDRGLG